MARFARGKLWGLFWACVFALLGGGAAAQESGLALQPSDWERLAGSGPYRPTETDSGWLTEADLDRAADLLADLGFLFAKLAEASPDQTDRWEAGAAAYAAAAADLAGRLETGRARIVVSEGSSLAIARRGEEIWIDSDLAGAWKAEDVRQARWNGDDWPQIAGLTALLFDQWRGRGAASAQAWMERLLAELAIAPAALEAGGRRAAAAVTRRGFLSDLQVLAERLGEAETVYAALWRARAETLGAEIAALAGSEIMTELAEAEPEPEPEPAPEPAPVPEPTVSPPEETPEAATDTALLDRAVAAEQRADAAAEEILALEQQVADLSADLERARGNEAELGDQLAAAGDRVAAAEIEAAELTEELAAARDSSQQDAEAERLRQEIAELTTKLTDAEGWAGDLEEQAASERAELQSRLQDLETGLTAATARAESAEAARDGTAEEVTALERQLTAAQEAATTAEARATAEAQRATEATEALVTAEEAQAQVQQALAEAEQALTESETTLARSRVEAEALRQAAEAASAEAKAARAETAEATAALAATSQARPLETQAGEPQAGETQAGETQAGDSQAWRTPALAIVLLLGGLLIGWLAGRSRTAATRPVPAQAVPEVAPQPTEPAPEPAAETPAPAPNPLPAAEPPSKVILDAVRRRDWPAAEALFAEISGIAAPGLRELLADPNGERLALACRAADLDRLTFAALYLLQGEGRSVAEPEVVAGAVGLFEKTQPAEARLLFDRHLNGDSPEPCPAKPSTSPTISTTTS